jgi:hypothetical protein
VVRVLPRLTRIWPGGFSSTRTFASPCARNLLESCTQIQPAHTLTRFLPCALSALTFITTAKAQTLPANDPCRLWANGVWGTTTVNNESLRASTWGESADPDRDGFVNLQEYAFGTAPTVRETTHPVTWSTTVTPGHFALTYKARTGDPALLILPQASVGLTWWNPPAPSAVSAWAGDPFQTFTEISRSAPSGNYVTVTQAATASMAGVPSQFTRVLVMRGAISAVTSPTDGLRFQEQIASGAGQTVESNTLTPSGFTGTISIAVYNGARLIVNGLDVGTSALVSAGSEVRLCGISSTGCDRPVM